MLHAPVHPALHRLILVLSLLVLVCLLRPISAKANPNFGNLTYSSSELMEPIAGFDTSNGFPVRQPGELKYGCNTVGYCNGHLVVVFAPDSGQLTGGLLFYDISDPRNPQLVNRVYEPAGRTKWFREIHGIGFAQKDGTFYLAVHTHFGLQVWDITSAQAPRLASELTLHNRAVDNGYVDSTWALFWRGNRIYVSMLNMGLAIVDATDPENLLLADRGNGKPNPMPTSEAANLVFGNVFALGNQLVITGRASSQGFASCGIDDPDNPYLYALSPQTSEEAYSHTFDGRRVISSILEFGSDARFVVHDLPSISRIQSIPSTLTIPRQLYSATQDQFIFQGCEDFVSKIDYSNPLAPIEVGRGSITGTSIDHGQVTPLGNLVFIGNDHGTGSALIPHQTSPDTTAPAVVAMSPTNLASSVSRCAAIGISFSDTILPESVNASSFALTALGSSIPLPGMYSIQQNFVHFSPEAELDAATTYLLTCPAGGVKDIAGNGIASEISIEFTTGPFCGIPDPHPQGLLAHWPLADDFDDEVGSNHGTPFGNYTFADGRVTLGPSSGFDLSENLTAWLGGEASLTFFIRTTTVGETDKTQAPLLTGYDPNYPNGAQWGWINSTGHIGYSIWGAYEGFSSTAINDGQWHAVAITRDFSDGFVRIYVDGNLETTFFTDVGMTGNPALSFGLEAELRDLRLYRDPLSLVEVQSIASAQGYQSQAPSALEIGTTGSFELQSQALPSSWDFGDGTPPTPFAVAPALQHSYAGPGNYTATLRIQTPLGLISETFAVISHHPVIHSSPARSSTLAIEGDILVACNPDNHSLAGIHTGSLTKSYEVSTGNQPTSVAGLNGNFWVSCLGPEGVRSELRVHQANDGTSNRVITLPYGSGEAVCLSPGDGSMLVSLPGRLEIRRYDSAGLMLNQTSVVEPLNALALSPDASTLFGVKLSHASQSPQLHQYSLASPSLTTGPSLAIPPDTTTADTDTSARGAFNYLRGLAVSPDGSTCWIPAKKDNIYRGSFRDGSALDFESMVRPACLRIDLTTNTEMVSDRLDFNDDSMAASAAFSPLGNIVYIAMEGTGRILLRDAYTGGSVGVITHPNLNFPRSLLVAGDRLYVHDFLGRALFVYDISVSGQPGFLKQIQLVSYEALSPQILAGKRIFNDASDPRMGRDQYMSCASCHLDGGEDHRVWDFTQLGEGLRNTTPLDGRGRDQGRFHWTGNFDEIQDFESQIRTLFSGIGFMTQADFDAGTTSLPLGDAKAGKSAQLDALAAYLDSLTTLRSSSPLRDPTTGGLSANAQLGQAIYNQEGCVVCHSGVHRTDSRYDQLHAMGTIQPASGRRLGGPLSGIDTPSLSGLWESAPYLHHGMATTLTDIFSQPGNHQLSRSPAEIAQLVEFLHSLDASPAPLAYDDWQTSFLNSTNDLSAMDQDLDGFSHLEEYALGLNPLHPDTVGAWRGEGAGRLNLNLDPSSQVLVELEAKQDLNQASWSNLGLIDPSLPIIPQNLPSPNRLQLRLRYSLPN